MKRHMILQTAVLALFTLISACTGQQKATEQETAETLVQETSSPSFLLTDSLLPRSLDLKQDISHMSYQELRLLRNYPYALHGFWFSEGDLVAFFVQHSDWYFNLCDSIYWAIENGGDISMPETRKDVKLTTEEIAFIDRIDRRMEEIKAACTTGTLENPLLCINLFQIENPDLEFAEKLTSRNFAIAKTDYEQLFQVYEMNDYLMMPSFITTDVYLQATHMYFSYVLKYLEKKKFVPALLHSLGELYWLSMLTGKKKEAGSMLQDCAEWNTTYFAIALRLLGWTQCHVPEKYKNDYEEELRKIEAQEDSESPYLGYTSVQFPYSLFKPRGHYNLNDSTQRYFKAMMWLQTASFCREDRTQLSRAAFMAQVFNALPETTRKECRGVFDALTYLMGEPDNLSVIEIADWMKKKGIEGTDAATDENVLKELDGMLTEAFKTRNRIKPKIAISCTDKINFMPQRYAADNEILGTMADETPNCERPFPKGLDVMATFGSRTAEQIIDTCYNDGQKWKEYGKYAQEMKKKFAGGIDWNNSMYSMWLETLMEMQQTDKNGPAFMQTPAWECKTLNTALASWAELKHDAILYSEQPIMAECGGAGLPDPIIVGYVEPNRAFWKGLKDMLATNRHILKRTGLMDETLNGKTEQLEEKVDFCLKMTEKELRHEALTKENYQTIRYMGSSLEWFTRGIINVDYPVDSWDNVKGAERSVAVVADVFTRNVLGCEKNGILHEATGHPDIIYVLVNIGGKVYLTSGAVFSYYEFVRPLGERLTDEEWQQMLKEGKAPQVPEWMRPLKLKVKPVHNETYIYSSGC